MLARRPCGSGLVNVDLTGNTVQVPVAVAANICGVRANVIAAGNFGGNARCDSASRSTATDGGGGGGDTQQEGLINVAITDNTIQVPVGIAANGLWRSGERDCLGQLRWQRGMRLRDALERARVGELATAGH